MRWLVVLAFVAARAWGCSCAVSPAGDPPCQSAWHYAAVFSGMVTEVFDPGMPTGPIDRQHYPQRKIRIRITEAFLGLDPKQQEVVIETGLGGGDCGYDFRRGMDYLIYASKKPDGAWSTGICSPTRLLNDATEDLKYFHQLDKAPPTSEIRVRAWDVNGTWRTGSNGQELPALPGTRVTISGPGVHQSELTDTTGRYVFSGLPPGEYKVEGVLEGYTVADGLRPVQVHSRGCAQVAVPLHLDRTVKGRILGKDGLPAVGVTVEALVTHPRHENEIPMADDSATTDGNGDYELRRLRAGEYYLGVSLGSAPTLQNPYTRWFYPGTEDPLAAGIVHVSDRPEVLRLDLPLPEAQHDRTIQGAVYWPDGRTAGGVNIFLEDSRWPWMTSRVVATTDQQGRFTVHALDGTRYRLHAAVFVREPISAEPVPIDPGTKPLDLKLVLTKKGYSPRDATSHGVVDWRKSVARQ